MLPIFIPLLLQTKDIIAKYYVRTNYPDFKPCISISSCLFTPCFSPHHKIRERKVKWHPTTVQFHSLPIKVPRRQWGQPTDEASKALS